MAGFLYAFNGMAVMTSKGEKHRKSISPFAAWMKWEHTIGSLGHHVDDRAVGVGGWLRVTLWLSEIAFLLYSMFTSAHLAIDKQRKNARLWNIYWNGSILQDQKAWRALLGTKVVHRECLRVTSRLNTIGSLDLGRSNWKPPRSIVVVVPRTKKILIPLARPW